MHDRLVIHLVAAALVTACGDASAPPAAPLSSSEGGERGPTGAEDTPMLDVSRDHIAASQRPVRLPPDTSDGGLARDATPHATAQPQSDPTSVCPVDVPSLQVGTTDVLDGAALVLTADTTEDRAMLRERLQRLVQREERERSIQRAIDLAAWDVPPEPTTVPSPQDIDDDDDPIRPTHGLHVVMIPRGVRIELRQEDGPQSATAHELRTRVEDDAQALRERRCPLTFQPA